MEFEFDPHKSQSNKSKHGIDFKEARELWNDPHLLEIEARSTDESRFLLIGMIKEARQNLPVARKWRLS